MSISAQFKRLGKDTFSYGLSSTLQKLITMFLFPIYARLLTPADFGIQDVILTSVFIITLFLILGLDSGVMLYYYEANDEEKTELISTYLIFEVAVSFPVVLVVWVNARFISEWVFNDPNLEDYLRYGILAIPFSLIVGAILSTLRLTFQTRKFVILTTVGVLLQIVSAIILVIIYRMEVRGVLLSILISNALQSILGLFLTYQNYRFIFSFIWLKKLLVVGIPLVPLALSMWVMNYSNRFFLIEYSDMESVGLLSIVNRVSSILLLFLSAFSSAWGPYAYSIAPNISLAKETYSKVLTYFTLFSMLGAVLLSIFSREVILILASSIYEKGSSLIFVYSLSSICWVVLYVIGIGTGIAKKNYHNTVAVIIGAIANTMGNYLLIPKWGVSGAAYASLLGNIIAMIYMYFAGQYYFRVNYQFRRVSIILILTISAGILGMWLDSRYESWSIGLTLYKAAIFALLILLMFITRIVDYNILNEFLVILKLKPRPENSNQIES